MSRTRFAYDAGFQPPAPVLPLRVASPLRGEGVLLPALLDTGADCTLIPVRVARRLRLPRVGRTRVAGVTGDEQIASVHAARVEVAGIALIAPLVALGEESIIGRDLLNRWHVDLDGPRAVARVRRPAKSRSD